MDSISKNEFLLSQIIAFVVLTIVSAYVMAIASGTSTPLWIWGCGLLFAWAQFLMRAVASSRGLVLRFFPLLIGAGWLGVAAFGLGLAENGFPDGCEAAFCLRLGGPVLMAAGVAALLGPVAGFALAFRELSLRRSSGRLSANELHRSGRGPGGH